MNSIERFAFGPLEHDFMSISRHEYSPYNIYDNTLPRTLTLEIDLRGNSYEVPVAFASSAVSAKSHGYETMVVPLNIVNTAIKRTASSILNSFNSKVPNEFTLVSTPDGNEYYGIPGLILDSRYQPLFILSYRIDATTNLVEKCLCRISQCILERQNEIIPKAIYRKLLPFYCTTPIGAELSDSTNIAIYVGHIHQRHLNGSKVEVIFGSPPNIILSHIIPTPDTISDDTFDRILNEELGEDDY